MPLPLLLLAWALAQAPDYDSFSDPDGNMTTEQHGLGLIAMFSAPGQIDAIYADAARGSIRAQRVFRMLETDYFPDYGRHLAEKVTQPPCLVPAIRELSGWCVPNWSFVDFLNKDEPGGARLREALFAGFAERARERNLENQIVLSAMTALLGISVAAAAVEAGEATAAMKQILADATPLKASKPGMGSIQYGKTGGMEAANRDFEVLARGLKVKVHRKEVRSCELSDGTTISVRPSSSGGPPMVEITPPAGNQIKIRYA
jgi:hypothetical protein